MIDSQRRDKSGRILIVDDQEQNIRLLTRILAKAGYDDVASTTNSDEALALYIQFKPDLVLLDLHMNGKDGFQVLEEIMLQSGDGYLPVLMITADDSAEVKRHALALGAKDFVGKPFDSAEVLLRINNLLETHFLYKRLRGQNSSEKSRSERASSSSPSSKCWRDLRRRWSFATTIPAITPGGWGTSPRFWPRKSDSIRSRPS